MKYLITTLQPDLIVAVEDREADGLVADGIVKDADRTEEEYQLQQEQLKQERERAEAEAEGRQLEEPVQIFREDGSLVGQPDKAQIEASEQAGQGDGTSDGEPTNLSGGEPVAPDLVESDDKTPQPDPGTGGKPVRNRKTSAKDAE
jgi:hypothetical protein